MPDPLKLRTSKTPAPVPGTVQEAWEKELRWLEDREAEIYAGGWQACAATMRAPGPCDVKGHTIADLIEEERPSDQYYSLGIPQMISRCTRCEREKTVEEFRHAVSAYALRMGETWRLGPGAEIMDALQAMENS
jgi:hypothetical protein